MEYLSEDIKFAFPYRTTDADGDGEVRAGMTLRDYFAGQALAALMSHDLLASFAKEYVEKVKPTASEVAYKQRVRAGIAATAYVIADAMIAERDKGAT